MATATWKGQILAKSDDIVVVENNRYFPRRSLRESFFQPSDHHTTCGWKGVASYLHVEVEGERNADAAWFYPDPLPAAEEIRDRVAFWKGVTVTDD